MLSAGALAPPHPDCSYLVDEGCESVIQALDLFLLISLHTLHCWVNLQLQGDQQTLIDGDRGDTGRRSAGGSRSVPEARHAASGGHTGLPEAHVA